MKYSESIERSAELLRQAIPMMSRQGAALHPVSYAVWYEYVSQANPPLRDAVDALLQREGRLDEAATQELFRRHVADVDPDTAQRVAEGFQRVLGGMAASATQAGNATQAFDDVLSRLSAELAADHSRVAGEALSGTRQMQAAVATLQQHLDDSRREIDALREEVRRARHESLVDSLTGLANRRAFDQRLAGCLAEQGARPVLVVADIDHFKRINDSFGHVFGDQVLRAVAEVLRQCAGEQALAARTGGEEFALLLPAMPLAGAADLAEQVRRTVAASRVRRKGGDQVLERVTLSLGVAPYRAGESAQAFFERADQALYQSKQGGRDRVTVAPG